MFKNLKLYLTFKVASSSLSPFPRPGLLHSPRPTKSSQLISHFVAFTNLPPLPLPPSPPPILLLVPQPDLGTLMGPPSGNGELVLALFPYLAPRLPPLSHSSFSRGCVDDCCIVWNLVGNLLDESFTDPSDLLTP